MLYRSNRGREPEFAPQKRAAKPSQVALEGLLQCALVFAGGD
jgi:hypothetical protein